LLGLWLRAKKKAGRARFDTAKGLVVLYQPQLDVFEGNHLEARAAVSVTPTGKTEPVFGAVWLKSLVETDFDSRTVDILNVEVPRVRFPGATAEQEQDLSQFLERQIPNWDLSLSLDRLLAMMELVDKRRMVDDGFDDTPPKILLATHPTVLVIIDGEPQLRDVENTELKHVVNSAFLIVFVPQGGAYYLYAGNEQWYTARQVTGPWQITSSVPSQVAALAPIEEEKEAEREAQAEAAEGEAPEAAADPSQPPAILVATEPTELIVTDGDPKWGPVEGNELLYVTNSESDVLMEVENQRYFVLLSGRWFASQSFTIPALPPGDST
jgi:hypothetical protein